LHKLPADRLAGDEDLEDGPPDEMDAMAWHAMEWDGMGWDWMVSFG